MRRILLSFYFVCCLLNSGLSVDTLLIDETFKTSNVKDFGYLHITENHTKNIQQILSMEDTAFTPISKTGLSFAPSNEVYWMKVTLKNISKKQQRLIVNMEYPLMNLLQFYTVSNHQLDSSHLMGDNFPFYQRAVEHRYFLHEIQIENNEVIDLYIFFNKANENLQLFTSIWTEDAFNKIDKKNTIIWSIYIGISLCIFLIIVSAAIFTRQKLLIYFALYSICTFMVIFTNIGLGFHYLWPDFPAFNQIANYTFIIIFFISFLELTRQFLDLPTNLPRFNRLYTILQIVTFLFIGILFTYKHYPPFALSASIYIGHSYLFFMTIALFAGPILLYRKTRDFSYLSYILGFLFFLFSFAFHMLITLDLIEDTEWTRFSVPIGLTIDMAILMIIFSDRIRLIYQLNNELQQKITQSQLDAAKLLLEGQFEERKRLSQELHDGISIQIALLKLKVSRLLRLKNEEAQTIIEDISTLAADIRSFTHAISPINLEEETLEDAIEDIIYKIENQTDIIINVSLSQFEEQLLTNETKQNIYQILQELLNNTIKYAEATTIDIILKTVDNQLFFSYQDDGIGFDKDNIKKGIGFKNMQARTELLKGTLNTNSSNDGSLFEFSFKLEVM